jgi:prepilin-type processing-associated H-X9-DG protein
MNPGQSVCHLNMFKPHWYQWHRNRGATSFLDPRLAPALFYSTILFVDGHAQLWVFRSPARTRVHPSKKPRIDLAYAGWRGKLKRSSERS